MHDIHAYTPLKYLKSRMVIYTATLIMRRVVYTWKYPAIFFYFFFALRYILAPFLAALAEDP